MELKNKYFHSVHSYIHSDNLEDKLNETLDKFEKIFKCGKILSYKNIKKNYGEINRNRYKNINGDDLISISLYESQPEECDLEYKNEISSDRSESAFQSFIIQEPSIVLNSRIKTEEKFTEFNGIYLERFVYDEISLRNMEAISIYGYGILEPFFHEVKLEDFEKCYNDGYYKNEIMVRELDGIIKLLNDYGYDIPVIDIMTGNEYKDNIEYREFLYTKKAKSIRVK